MRKESIIMIIIFIISLGVTGCSLSPTPPQPYTMFQENFDNTTDYPLGPFQFDYPNFWDDVAGDHSYWSIVEGVDGHALQCIIPNGGWNAIMVNFSTSTSDTTQTIQADFQADHFSTYTQYRLIGKCTVGALPHYPTYYALTMEGTRQISILKSNSDGSYGSVAMTVNFDTDFSTSTVYTLTLKFSGSNITGTVSGGGYTKTIKGYDSEYYQGHMGLEVRTGDDGSPNGCKFDNIKVTACN